MKCDDIALRREWVKRDLIRRARAMAKRLEEIAMQLESHDRYRPSSLGELQSEGTIFDTQCARYWTLCDIEEELKAVTS